MRSAVHGHARKKGRARTKTKTYQAWQNMKHRCTDTSNDRYAGRGISYDPSWEKFENFLADVGEAPPGKELDRVDNNAGYSKSNCRWVSVAENRRNTHRRKTITWCGETRHYIEWADKLGINPDTLRSRVFRRNWPIDRAMTEGVNKK